MPLFATLVAAGINGLTAFYSSVMAYQAAIAWARRTFIIALGAAFILAVTTCVQSLFSMISGASLPARFLQGLGMVIPSNAAAVLACIGSVYLGCVVYRLKLEGLRW